MGETLFIPRGTGDVFRRLESAHDQLVGAHNAMASAEQTLNGCIAARRRRYAEWVAVMREIATIHDTIDATADVAAAGGLERVSRAILLDGVDVQPDPA